MIHEQLLHLSVYAIVGYLVWLVITAAERDIKKSRGEAEALRNYETYIAKTSTSGNSRDPKEAR